MDPYFSNRGSRPGFFSQPNNSFMSNYYDQNVFSEENSSSLHGQGPRMNFHISDSTMFDQGVSSERIAGPYAGNITSDQFRYNSYVPSNIPYMNQSHSSRSDSYSSDDTSKFARNFNQDSIQTNRLNIPINNEEVNYILDGSACSEINVPPKHNVEKNNQEREKAYNFSRKDACYPDETNIAEADCMKVKHNLEVSKDMNNSPDRIMASENIIENEMDVDDSMTDTVSHDVEQNEYAEKAVDLSKLSIPMEKDQVSGLTDAETTIIKKEKIDHNEITETSEAAEYEDDYDSDKTIENEPVDKLNKVFKCTECDKVYRCDSSLKKHLNIHAGLFKCKVCNKLWSSKYALVQHEKVHSGEREGNLCTICGKTFFDSSSLNKHIKSVHAGIKTFSCDRCDLSFYARKTLVEHIRVHTGERPFKCKLCPKTYKRISDLNHHVRGHTGETKHVCDVCGKGVRRLSELKVHMNQHRDDMFHVKKSDCVCSWCSKTFKNQQELDDHIKNHCDHVTQAEYNRDEQDSALIAAAINSDLPDGRHNSVQKGAERKIGMQDNIGETEIERTSFQAKMKQLYKQAGLKPSTNSSYMYMLNSQMPVSDASFHAYFPLPGEKETYPAQKEPGEIRRTDSKLDRPVQHVDNWLDKNFSGTEILHKDSGPNLIQPQSLMENVRYKRNNDPYDTAAKQLNTELENYLNDTPVNNVDTNTTKTGVSGEKQKSIATVIDKLAEKKAKDLEATLTDDVQVKSEIMDDGEETDDYEIDSHDKCEPETVHQINEQEKVDEISNKHIQKRKSRKKQNRKQNMKAKPKLKHTRVKKHDRKQQPKKLKKSKQKMIGKSNKKESEGPLETSPVKSENESETDDFPSNNEPTIKDGLRFCSECGKTFKSRSAFRKHKEMHKGMYTCTECNKSLSSGWSLRQHMQTHTSSVDRTRYPCSVCEKAFCDKSSLNKHIKSVHMGYRPFKCTECDRTFSERKTMAEHLRTHTGERPFLCTFCPKTFKRVSELNHHIRWHTGETKHTCDTCGRGFRRLSELQRHMTLHTEEKPYQCSICGKEFRNFSVLREHTLRHLGQSKYICERCGKKYYKKTHLMRHLRSDRDCTKCKYCLITMADPLERAKHEETHEGELKYSCTVCDKRFRGRGPLNKHRRIHSQDRSYVCDQCGATFIQSNHLKQHYRTHTGEKPFSCLVCGKAFAQSGTLYSHMKTHLPDGAMRHGSSAYQYGASDSSDENEIQDLDVIKHAVNIIEAKVK